jgi:hypothetical protein
MRKLLVGCSAFTLLLASAPALAMPQQIGNQAAPAAGDAVIPSGSGGPSATAQPAATPEKKVCKLLPSSYSHMNQRVCLTAKQWEQVERENQ